MRSMNWRDLDGDGRVADASAALARTLRKANRELRRQGKAGLESARDFGGEALDSARRAGRTAQGLVAEKPMEAMLIAGAIGFALGWIVRRACAERIVYIESDVTDDE
jgi:ElaB/YqjD/DUF883 family membrane-anchored ribosome-binding protein